MTRDLLNQFDPNPDALLHAISAHIDDNMLQWISSIDYGGSGQDEHRIALRQIRDTGTFPERMAWYPAEVLELTRWIDPDVPEEARGRTGEFGHWMRAFSCAALLRATREPYDYGDGDATGESLIRLILSLRVLPIDVSRQAASMLAWLLIGQESGDEEQTCAYGIGLLWFALHVVPPAPDKTLVFLTQSLAQHLNKFVRGETLFRVIGPPPSDWEKLGAAFFNLDLSGHQTQLREWVQWLGSELA